MSYDTDRAALLELFPRGLIAKDSDGTAIVRGRPRSKAKGDHLFIQAKGRLLGLFYAGRPDRYLSRIPAGFIARHLRCDGEGILHLTWAPQVAKALPMFSRGLPRGSIRSLRPVAEATSQPRSPEVASIDHPRGGKA